jgi:hypothetical protein
MEVTPPAVVWEKLSAGLDEINADIVVSKKIHNIRVAPPQDAWKVISQLAGAAEMPVVVKKSLFTLRRLAAAAVFIGMVVATWVFVKNNKQENTGMATTEAVNKTTGEAESKKRIPVTAIQPERKTPVEVQFIARNNKPTLNRPESSFGGSKKSEKTPAEMLVPADNMITIENLKPAEKKFTLPVEDFTMAGDGAHYLTMVNANGRLAKIPAHLAHLVPHLQDKPVEEDYFEIMFGQGSYWKETLNEWRKKLASAPVIAGDNFTSFVELLKTVQSR